MLIQVIYLDHTHDTIDSLMLTYLIREGRVRSFKRASGWVHIGKDRIRKYDYGSRERSTQTKSQEKNLLHTHEACL
jgi:hypothetical protein